MLTTLSGGCAGWRGEAPGQRRGSPRGGWSGVALSGIGAFAVARRNTANGDAVATGDRAAAFGV